ncbi:MAG TPA: metal-dependent hydrolase [Verrucomicrobiae bacterium]|nr:metal-dependent hydrolase [Verrucomicrobiae bacterium]
MSPITHFIGSWLVAAATANNVRDRRLITLAGVLPDLDGLGMVVDVAKSLSSGQEMTFHYYQKFHHLWLHGWPGALLVAVVLACFARQRWRVAIWCLVTFHLHLLCDLLGSRGPSPSDLWPICYGEPLFRHPVWFWKGQWRLDGWQNLSVFIVVFGLAVRGALKRGYSFVEIFSQRADSAVMRVLRKWSGRPVLEAND